MNKVLAIYNICGILGRNNVNYYKRALDSLLNQDPPLHVVLSDCRTVGHWRRELSEIYQNRISYNFIDETIPLNLGVNFTLKKMTEHFGKFDAYLYVDSGVDVGETHAIQKMYDLLYKTNSRYSMVAAQVDSDNGYGLWGIQLTPNQETIIPVGKTVNLHCQMFSKTYFEHYNNRLLPDIFAADTSESIFSFLTEALQTKFVIHPHVLMHHELSLDGPSVGMGRGGGLYKCPKNHIQLFEEGRPLGFGYEECGGVCVHDRSLYDEHGNIKNPVPLYHFLLENVFLPEKELDIKHLFVPKS